MLPHNTKGATNIGDNITKNTNKTNQNPPNDSHDNKNPNTAANDTELKIKEGETNKKSDYGKIAHISEPPKTWEPTTGGTMKMRKARQRRRK